MKKADILKVFEAHGVEFAGEPSREIRVERTIYEGGKVLARQTWYTHYSYEARIVRYGTKPHPEPVAPPKEEKPKEDDPPTTTGPGDGARRV